MSEPLTRKQIVKLVEMFVGIDGEVFAYDLLTHDAALRARIEQDQGLVAKINELTNDLNRVKQERDEFLEGQRKLEAFVATTLARVRELEEFIDVHRDDSPTYKDIAALTAQNAQERFAEYETQLAALTQAHQQAVEALAVSKKALGECLMLSRRMIAKAKPTDVEWQHVQRWCKEAGCVEAGVLRDE